MNSKSDTNSIIESLITAASTERDTALERFFFRTSIILMRNRHYLVPGINLMLFIVLATVPTLAQTNPWGGSGTTRLANAGSNLLVIGTWLAFFIGLLSFLLIPIFVKMEWNYQKLLVSGFVGLGGFVIIGSIAYEIVNLGSITMPDPTYGN